ncbi:MAG: hypothetical protein ABIX12_12880, partial [Rubrivivax sp.]
ISERPVAGSSAWRRAGWALPCDVAAGDDEEGRRSGFGVVMEHPDRDAHSLSQARRARTA